MDRIVKLPTTLPTRIVALAAGLALCAAAAGQSADPTLPPPGLDAAAAGSAAAPAAPAGPQLQSILVSREPGGRRIAVISGEMVRQGGRVNGAVLESVGEDRVVLRRGKSRQVLRLYAATPPPSTTPRPAMPPALPEQR